MSKKKEPIDKIGYWSIQKLDILGKYLPAYSKIMNKQSWCPGYFYVDAFTGTIYPQDKETDEYLAGSPIRALETEPPFSRYYFIEKDQARFKKATELGTEYQHRNVVAIHGDCNEILRGRIIPELAADGRQRALVFLDPYGLNVNWVTVQSLAETRQCDVFINFPVMGVLRNLPRDQRPEDEKLKCICNVFGDERWGCDLYSSHEVPTLMGDTITRWVRAANIEEMIVCDYIERLHTCFEFVTKPRLMTNSKSATLYALVLASQNNTAIKIMNAIFNKSEQNPIKRPGSRFKGQGTLL